MFVFVCQSNVEHAGGGGLFKAPIMLNMAGRLQDPLRPAVRRKGSYKDSTRGIINNDPRLEGFCGCVMMAHQTHSIQALFTSLACSPALQALVGGPDSC